MKNKQKQLEELNKIYIPLTKQYIDIENTIAILIRKKNEILLTLKKLMDKMLILSLINDDIDNNDTKIDERKNNSNIIDFNEMKKKYDL